MGIPEEILFPSMHEGNAVLLVGAGASATDRHKFFGRHVIELYEAKLGKSLGTQDFVEFTDTIEALEQYSKADFRDFLATLLSVLKPTDAHKTLATIPWRQILTTNYDLLIEKAFDTVRDTAMQSFEPLPIRSSKEIPFAPANDQVPIYKLNGCLSDKNKYPLVMSSADFARAKTFYKRVLSPLQHTSPKIVILAIGYSFADSFAKRLFEELEAANFRDPNRWTYNIDPYLEGDRINFLRSKYIETISTDMSSFFQNFSQWREAESAAIVQSKGLGFVRRDNAKVTLAPYIQHKLGDDLLQLTEKSPSRIVDAKDYYLGEEPTFDVVRKNYDVIKTHTLENLTQKVKSILETPQTLFPILLLRGSFGTGKSTTEYRLLLELWKNESLNCAVFRVGDAKRLNAPLLVEVFDSIDADNIILHFDQVDVNSSFKEMLALRQQLSATEFHRQILFIGSVRENISERQLAGNKHPNLECVDIDSPLDEAELLDLITKLSSTHLIENLDAKTKHERVRDAKRRYAGDSFVTLLATVIGGKHERDLFETVDRLPTLAQKAFHYTAVLHQHELMMPAGVLRRLVSTDWNKFIDEVIKIDCKGVLIQVEDGHRDLGGDIHFRTKHALVAQRYVERTLGNQDKLFDAYRDVIVRLQAIPREATLAVNLLKSLSATGTLSEQKIARLYDEGARTLTDDPHFALHYAINLQHRNDEQSLQKALDILVYGEGLRDRRNLRMIHRRAVVNFKLAQLNFAKDGNEISEKTYRLLDEAEQLFEVKRIWEPESAYSYVDYLIFELWGLRNLNYTDAQKLSAFERIDRLFDQSERLVHENRSKLAQLKVDFNALLDASGQNNTGALSELLDDSEARPYVLLRLLRSATSESERDSIISDLTEYAHLSAVSETFLHHYGERLFVPNNRTELFKLLKFDSNLPERWPIYAYFYSYVADAYNQHWQTAMEHLDNLQRLGIRLPRGLSQVWRNPDGEIETFEGVGLGRRFGQRKVRLIDMQRECELIRGSRPVARNEKVNVHLVLFPFGFRVRTAT
jgi:hypothetical protein